jgi:hypothetical protein
VDVLDVSDWYTPEENQMITEEQQQSQIFDSVECAAPLTLDDYSVKNGETLADLPASHSTGKESRIDSGISSSMESSEGNNEELPKEDHEGNHSTKKKPVEAYISKKDNKPDYNIRHHSKREDPTDSVSYGKPGEVRQASWMGEDVPPDEPEDPTPVYVAPHTKKEKSDTEVDRDFADDVPEKDETADDAVASSGEESTGSVIEHSSPEADCHDVLPVSFLFQNKPLVSALSKKEKSKSRRIKFADDQPTKYFTYSAEEYDRANDDIDPVTASAEWELEKRVEKMDVFSVDLGKGKILMFDFGNQYNS